MESRKNKRLARELKMLSKEADIFTVKADDFSVWKISFDAPSKSVYTGEKFTLANKTPIPIQQQLCQLTSPSKHLRLFLLVSLLNTNISTPMDLSVCLFSTTVF